MERVEIGPSPCDERCAQSKQENYRDQAIYECLIFSEQIQRHYGTPPEGVRILTRFERGSGYEVVVEFNENDPNGVSYTYDIDSDIKGVLDKWDEHARADLLAAGYLQAA